MPNPIDSVVSPIEVSTDNAAWKVLICTASYTAQIQTQTTTTDTQCGRIIGLGIITFNPTVQAVCDQAPSDVQVSYNDCVQYQKNKTKLYFRIQSPASGSFAAGDAYYLSGECYITDTTLTNTTNDPVKFSVTFSGQGELTTVAP